MCRFTVNKEDDSRAHVTCFSLDVSRIAVFPGITIRSVECPFLAQEAVSRVI